MKISRGGSRARANAGFIVLRGTFQGGTPPTLSHFKVISGSFSEDARELTKFNETQRICVKLHGEKDAVGLAA